MQILNRANSMSLAKKVSVAAVLAAMLLVVGTPRAIADDGDCRRRTARADHNLHDAIEHHGYNSRQANHWRHELHEAREHCWQEHKRWWDVDGSRWRSAHDWDDHDHN
jgi:hypothetical protein